MRPSEALRAQSQADWTAITRHPFANALGNGTLPDAAMAWYLVQDYRFIEGFVRLLAQAIAHAPTLADAVPAAQFLALITGAENTYFQRSLAALGHPDMGRDQPTAAATSGFQNLMARAASSGRYSQMLAVLVVAEWTYLDWATHQAPPQDGLPFYLAEWITLHSGPDFAGVVGYLRDQLDAALIAAPEEERSAAADLFREAVLLERDFFDAAMARADQKS
ncbi:MAG: TenA family protein [Rhodobacteraceae bacterium]|nr:TenA family protein [Paracoccaceae bacterium]